MAKSRATLLPTLAPPVVILAIGCCLSYALSACANSPTEVWLLKLSGLIVGQYDVYVSDAGLRANNLKSKMVIVARPPNWQVCAFNADAKTTWTGSIDEFHPTARGQRFFTIAGGFPNISSVKLSKSREFTQLGLKGRQFYSDDSWRQEQEALLKKGLVNKQCPSQATYFAATGITRAAQPAKILEILFDAPRKILVPIDYSYKKLGGGKQEILRTLSVKSIVPPADWLDVPGGLKKVGTMEEVNLDRSAQNGIDQMLDNIPEPKSLGRR